MTDPLPAGPGILDVPVAGAKITGLTPGVAAKLAKGLGVETIADLLEQVPRRYLDLSKTLRIGDVKVGQDVTTRAKVIKVEGRHLRSNRHLLSVTVGDGSGYLELVWWNQPFRAKAFSPGAQIAAAGRVERQRGRLQMVNPFVETLGGDQVHVGRIIPVHPATQGVTATQIRRYVHDALKRYRDRIDDPLPAALVAEHGSMPRAEAIEEMHFPSSWPRMMQARKRLAFEEFFVLSAGLGVRKHRRAASARAIVHDPDPPLLRRFLDALPFATTGAQRRAIAEIAADMARGVPMDRLLQGEVGSGKTVVAVAAALIGAATGTQTALMAPTEVLAEQHARTIRALLHPLADAAPDEGRLFSEGFRVELLTGSAGAADRKRALAAAADGSAQILVGTHALIQDGVQIARLGLAIVDEQHRFGVHQRVALRQRGGDDHDPHVLIMTATPIPRTLSLTLYGDLDVSVLDEMPPGRTPVVTRIVSNDAARRDAYAQIRDAIAQGRQAFVICPLVEGSAHLEVKAAESEYERIRAEVFPDLRVGLVHGRLKSNVKDEAMRAFRDRETDLLVATTVVEVGVDVPNATHMIIEDADRFGLSQLHQLRGRIGRGSESGICYLFTSVSEDDETRADAMRRLRAMEETNDGFALAELDLEQRGTGQIFGRGGGEGPAQTGRSDLRFANLLRDTEVLLQARAAAFALVDGDPTLDRQEHRALLAEVRRRFAGRLDWIFAS